jgi:hypothetical protein
MAIERPQIDIASGAAGRAVRPQELIADRDGRPDRRRGRRRIRFARRSFRSGADAAPQWLCDAKTASGVRPDPRNTGSLPAATLVAFDLIKRDGEDYRPQNQTSLGARKPAHSSAGGGGGGGGTPRK